MEAAPLYSVPCQDQMQAAAQDIALAERLSVARAEDVSAPAAPDEIGKQLHHIRVEVTTR